MSSLNIEKEYQKILVKIKNVIVPTVLKYMDKNSVKNIIVNSPSIIPFINSDNCLAFTNITLNHKYDIIIAEPSRKSVNLYLLYFNYYYINSEAIIEDRNISDVYWKLEQEDFDEDLWWFRNTLPRSRKEGVIRFKRTIKETFNLRNLRISEILMVLVVDELTQIVRDLVDVANEELEANIAAMSIEKYCWEKESCVLVSKGYSW